MNTTSWIINLNNTAEIPPSADSVSATVETLLNFMAYHGPFGVDLIELRHHEVNPIHLATILRVTYLVKNSVKGWHEALVICAKSCKHFNVDANDALYGLL